MVNGSRLSLTISRVSHQSDSSNSMYSLVFFTTEDGFSLNVQRKMQLFKDVSELYHRHYHSKSILFTTTPELVSFFKNSSVITSPNFAYNSRYISQI